MKYSVALIAVILSGALQAESLDGSRILEQEAQRAQELQKLQHQAEVLRQRAEITRYMDEIEKNGGDVSDLDLQGIDPAELPSRRQRNAAPSLSLPAAVAAEPKSEQVTVPRLLHIEEDRAAFSTAEGTFYAAVGGTLPGGYRVVDLSLRNGARLQKNGVQYDIDVAW